MPTGVRRCGCPSRRCRCFPDDGSELLTSNVPRRSRQKRSRRTNEVPSLDANVMQNSDKIQRKDSFPADQFIQNSSECNCGGSSCSCNQQSTEDSCNVVANASNQQNLVKQISSHDAQPQEIQQSKFSLRVIDPAKARPCGCSKRKCTCGALFEWMWITEHGLHPSIRIRPNNRHTVEDVKPVNLKLERDRKRKGPGTGRRACGCPSRICRCPEKSKQGTILLII